MTYSINFKNSDLGRGLNYYDCKKSDTLNAGILEQVLDDSICWHGIKSSDLNRVLDYISLEYPPMLIEIEAEYLRGDKVFPRFVCGMRTGGFTYGRHLFTADEAAAMRSQRTI